MKITKITIILIDDVSDCVLLYTDLPPSTWPWKISPYLKLDCSFNSGEEYVKKNFPNIDYNIINRRKLSENYLYEKLVTDTF